MEVGRDFDEVSSGSGTGPSKEKSGSVRGGGRVQEKQSALRKFSGREEEEEEEGAEGNDNDDEEERERKRKDKEFDERVGADEEADLYTDQFTAIAGLRAPSLDHEGKAGLGYFVKEVKDEFSKVKGSTKGLWKRLKPFQHTHRTSKDPPLHPTNKKDLKKQQMLEDFAYGIV